MYEQGALRVGWILLNGRVVACELASAGQGLVSRSTQARDQSDPMLRSHCWPEMLYTAAQLLFRKATHETTPCIRQRLASLWRLGAAPNLVVSERSAEHRQREKASQLANTEDRNAELGT
jgi:hypothetical protein